MVEQKKKCGICIKKAKIEIDLKKKEPVVNSKLENKEPVVNLIWQRFCRKS